MDSILNTIKKLLGIDSTDDSFDIDIIVLINSIIPTLSQIGVGSSKGFMIMSDAEVWNDFLDPNSNINFESVKMYIFLKTKIIFDPPTSQTVMDAFNNSLKELEWRLMLAIETNNLEVT